MRFFTARRLAVAFLVPALLTLSLIPGCSNQGEGDRCGPDPASGFGPSVDDNADCGDGLVCTKVSSLANRCCYPNRVTDSRCTVVEASAGGASSGGASNVGGAGAAAGSGAAGASTAGSAPDTDAGAAGSD